jgi:hypothetical protein
MPLLETRGSGSAIAFGLTASSLISRTGPSVTSAGAGFSYAADGEPLYIGSMSNWGVWKNLPSYLKNAPVTTVVNVPNNSMRFTIDGNVRVWLIRDSSWTQVPTAGWTLFASNQPPLITGYETSTWQYYYRDYTSGTYTGFSTTSAMYFFTATSGALCKIADGLLLSQTNLVWNVDAFHSASSPNDGTWYDIMNGANASVSNTGSVSYNGGSGRTGRYYVYNGSSRSYAGPTGSMDTPNGFTAGAWVYTNSNSTTGRIFQKDEISSTRVWEFGNNGGSMRSEVWSSNGNTILTGGTTVPIGAWHHMVLTSSANGVVKHYQNGVQTGTGSIESPAATLRTANTGLYLGGSWSSGEYYNGLIAQAYLYKAELSAAEVLANHNTFKAAYGL